MCPIIPEKSWCLYINVMDQAVTLTKLINEGPARAIYTLPFAFNDDVGLIWFGPAQAL